ncbi:MAG: anaerobic glycerol-3-phosphate dehydrogenase subunit A [Bacteroidales bacterium]|nr:anaerobic glycerol-3-phosphate dehydrogenase subunit A [Bacteroidales bacterium]
MRTEYDVIIIGGGATGAGTARDCAMRGLRTLLVERADIADGASGRNHGLLHSGARYAVNDRESAAECIGENLILRRIAASCVEETEGLFITLPEDGLEYQAKFVESCKAAGIKAEVLDPKLALRLEPEINPGIIGAVRVPDASVDPFRLVAANVLDAKLHGADILTGWEVVEFLKEMVTITGVRIRNVHTGEIKAIRAHYTVNAAGIWGAHIAELAGAHIGMLPSKGALLVFGHRAAKMVINRCRKPANADILVPGDVVSVIGTTSDKVPFEECDDMKVTRREVEILLTEGCKLVPSLASTRIIRAYAGVRPLVADDSDPSGRNVSRGIVLLDHSKRDGIRGFVSITGGKLTTYRLMAEQTTDLICQKLGLEKPCETAVKPLPGSEPQAQKLSHKTWTVGQKAAFGRQGARITKMDFSKDRSEEICECEHVTRAEIAYAVKELGVKTLDDLRRRTRVGMGTCQSSFCVLKAAKVLAEELGTPDKAEQLAKDFLRERWKGIKPVCWGDQMREAEHIRNLYKEAAK